MKFLFDIFPVILFFIVYKLSGIYAATGAAIVASFIQVGAFWAKHKRIENTQLVTLVVIALLGGSTIVFQNEIFIKWKPSIVNWLFAMAFLGSHFVGNKTLVERTMGKNISLPAVVWSRLNISWVIFFIGLGIANLYVVYHFDTDTWVNFKLFGIFGLMLALIIAQAIYMSRYIDNTDLDNN